MGKNKDWGQNFPSEEAILEAASIASTEPRGESQALLPRIDSFRKLKR